MARRHVEADYIAVLAEVCPPATWRDIVQRAVDDAKDGDAKARAWLATYLLVGDSKAWSFERLAVADLAGEGVDGELADRVAREGEASRFSMRDPKARQAALKRIQSEDHGGPKKT